MEELYREGDFGGIEFGSILIEPPRTPKIAEDLTTRAVFQLGKGQILHTIGKLVPDEVRWRAYQHI